jgi:general secretion pathway protein G
MARRREQTIFFPWERQGGFWRLRWTRSRPAIAALGMIILLLLLGARGRTESGVRSTRAQLLLVRAALDAYRADHQMKCPASLTQLQTEGYMRAKPIDAWGRSLRLTCPGRRNPKSYDLVSLGPEGDTRGLFRIE